MHVLVNPTAFFWAKLFPALDVVGCKTFTPIILLPPIRKCINIVIIS